MAEVSRQQKSPPENAPPRQRQREFEYLPPPAAVLIYTGDGRQWKII